MHLLVIVFIYFVVCQTSLSALDNNTLLRISQEEEKKLGDLAIMITRIKTGEVVFEYRPDILYSKKLCIGSLIKPFTLLAASRWAQIDPEEPYFCDGFKEFVHSKICWLKKGHGLMNLEAAIAFSCNSYFYYKIIVPHLKRSLFDDILKDFNISGTFHRIPLSEKAFFRTAVGLDAYLRVKPVKILLAYNAIAKGILRDRYAKHIKKVKISGELKKVIFNGMKQAVSKGTAPISNINNRGKWAAKTGTGAGLTHGRYTWRKTSGWIVAMDIKSKNGYSFLVMVDKGTGSKEASNVAKRIIVELEKED